MRVWRRWPGRGGGTAAGTTVLLDVVNGNAIADERMMVWGAALTDASFIV